MYEQERRHISDTDQFIVATYSQQARRRCEEERKLIRAKLQAYGQFEKQVRAIEFKDPASHRVSGHPRVLSKSRSPSGMEKLLNGFIEHIGPFYDGDLTDISGLAKVISEEFSPDLATALITTDDLGQFGSGFREELCSKITVRREELESAQAAVDTEVESLQSVEKRIHAITDWFVEKNGSHLTRLGFDELRDLHECVKARHDELENLAETRQCLIHQTTGDSEIPINHARLVGKLYEDFPVSYPALADIAILSNVSVEAKDTICRHLTRRA